MAKRADQPIPSGRRRTPVPPVKKPFPWGTVAVSAVVGALLIGILVYAVSNQGSGFIDPLKAADKKVQGVQVSGSQESKHVEGPVKYDKSPPIGGKHNSVAQTCQVYTSAVADEHAVHSLEHGAVWVTYRPDLAPSELAILRGLVSDNPYRLLSPYPGLTKPISLQAWGRQVFADKASDKQVGDFLEAYTNGPQAPERGASCSGTTDPGPLRAAAAPPASPTS